MTGTTTTLPLDTIDECFDEIDHHDNDEHASIHLHHSQHSSVKDSQEEITHFNGKNEPSHLENIT